MIFANKMFYIGAVGLRKAQDRNLLPSASGNVVTLSVLKNPIMQISVPSKRNVITPTRTWVAAHLTNDWPSGPSKFYNNFNQNDCRISLGRAEEMLLLGLKFDTGTLLFLHLTDFHCTLLDRTVRVSNRTRRLKI